MKLIIVFILSILSLNAISQQTKLTFPQNVATGKYEWRKTVHFRDSFFTKKMLIQQLRQWSANEFDSPKESLQIEDTAAGFFVYTDTVRIIWNSDLIAGLDGGDYHFRILIWVRDGAYMYEIKNIYRLGKYMDASKQYIYFNNSLEKDIEYAESGKKAIQKILVVFSDHMNLFIKNFEQAMITPAVSLQKW